MMEKNPTTLYSVDLQVILYIIYIPYSWNTIIYIVVEVIAGFDFNAREEKRFRRTRSSRARGRDLLRDSYTDRQHRLRGGFSHGGIRIYTHTPRFLLFRWGQIINNCGSGADRVRLAGRIRRRRSRTLFGDSPGGKIPITQFPINQSRYIRLYVYIFNRPGKLIEFGRA